MKKMYNANYLDEFIYFLTWVLLTQNSFKYLFNIVFIQFGTNETASRIYFPIMDQCGRLVPDLIIVLCMCLSVKSIGFHW